MMEENKLKKLILLLGLICLFYVYILNALLFIKAILFIIIISIFILFPIRFKKIDISNHKTKFKRLNLGCGKDIREGYINLDRVALKGVDVIQDIEKTPFPFEKNYFDEVYASNILEHIDNFVQLMEEVHRICKKNAIIKIIVPYFACAGAFQDPEHKRFFTLRSFNYSLPENYNNFITKARFKIIKKKLKFTRKNWLINLPLEFVINYFQWAYERFFCFIIPMQEVYYELKVIK